MKAPELKDRLEESEKLIQEMTVTWEEKLRKTEEIAQVTNATFCCASQLQSGQCGCDIVWCFLYDPYIFITLCLMNIDLGEINAEHDSFSYSGEAKAVGESGHLFAVLRHSCRRGQMFSSQP